MEKWPFTRKNIGLLTKSSCEACGWICAASDRRNLEWMENMHATKCAAVAEAYQLKLQLEAA